MRRLAVATAAFLLLPAAPAMADPTLGIRPLGGDYESARTVGPGNWAIEGGAWAPQFTDPGHTTDTDADRAILARWQAIPAWPELRGLYGLQDGNEIVADVGPIISGGYRRLFLHADAPWPGEYLQVLFQLGAGIQLSNTKQFLPFLPAVPNLMGYVRVPAIFEAGPLTLHVAGGGYYLFNNQPIVNGDLGLEFTPFEHFQVGGLVKVDMDSAKITPTDGTWSFGFGARYQIGSRWVVQADVNQDAAPPEPASGAPTPRIEYPYQSVRATVGYYF